MGIAALPDICRGLLAAGMDAKTPAAVLEQGTTAGQHRISAALGELEAVCASMTVRTPAIIVVGKVCALAEQFAWAEKRPLGGIKVLLTRPKELSSSTAQLLRELGAEVLELPTIRIQTIQDHEPLRRAIRRLCSGGYDWIVFTSPNGVRIFYRQLMEVSDLRALCQVKIAAIGQGTQKALLEVGLKADFLPSVSDGETLGTELYRRCTPDARILIPRAAGGGPELIHELERDGRQIDDLPLYETVYTVSRLVDIRELLREGNCYAVFTSSSTVKGFAESAAGADLSPVKAVCIGRQTGSAAAALGMHVWIAPRASLEALVQELEDAVGGKPPIIKEQTEKEKEKCRNKASLR